MTRGYFASQGINATIQTVRMRRQQETPNRTAVIDIGALAPKFWGAPPRITANVIITNIRMLQDFFPRILLAPDGPIKPGKEDRTTSPPTKQQHLDGNFDLAYGSYKGQQLAMFELVQQQAKVQGTEDLLDLEVVASGGEGEVGAWLGYEAEMLSRNGVHGHMAVQTSDDALLDTVQPRFQQVNLYSAEEPLTPDAARALAASLKGDPPRHPVNDALGLFRAASDGSPPQVSLVMRDGDFLHGPAEEVVQRWRFAEDGMVLELDVVNIPAAIKASGEAVESSFLAWANQERNKIVGRKAASGSTAFPRFEAAVLAFDPSKLSPTTGVDVAMATEAVFGDFGCATSGYGIGHITFARLGMLALGNLEVWRMLVAERVPWAETPTPFYRAILRHFVHPGAANPSSLLQESLEIDGSSRLPYSLWISPRPHAHRLLGQVFSLYGLPPATFKDLLDSDLQSRLWKLFSGPLGLVPSVGWTVSSSAVPGLNVARPIESGLARSATEPHLAQASGGANVGGPASSSLNVGFPVAASATTSAADVIHTATSAAPPSPTVQTPTPPAASSVPSAPSIAGSGRPSSARMLPLLERNFTSKHWELLGVGDDWRSQQGTFTPTRAYYSETATLAEQQERNMAELEAEELAAEVDDEWRQAAASDVAADNVLPSRAGEKLDNILRAMTDIGLACRAKREAQWTRLIDEFISLARKVIPDLAVPPGALYFEHVDEHTIALHAPSGEQLCVVKPVLKIDSELDSLEGLSADDQELIVEGAFSFKGLRQISGHELRRKVLRRALEGTSRFLGIPVVSERQERVSRIIDSGIATLLKPSVLRFLLELPTLAVDNLYGRAMKEAVPTWFGVRMLLDFCEEIQVDGSSILAALLVQDETATIELAARLQQWSGLGSGADGNRRSWLKPHILAALGALGVAPIPTLRELMVPPREHGKNALDFFRALPDHEWISTNALLGAVTTVRAGSVRNIIGCGIELALAEGAGPDRDVEELDDRQKRQILGGEVVWTLYTLPLEGVDPKNPIERPWWRKIGGKTGNPLEKEIAARNVARKECFASTLEFLRTWPDGTFITTDDMTPWVNKLSSAFYNTSPGAKGLIDFLIETVIEGTGVDMDDAIAVKEYVGGEYRIEQAKNGKMGVKWYSADPDKYPHVERSGRKRKAAPEVYAPGTRRSARNAKA